MANFNFKLLSLNARGIRDFHKRKTIFTWIKKQKVDIAFLQETYSSQEIENQFKAIHELNSCVTMATYWVPDLPSIKSFSGQRWRSIWIFANGVSYARSSRHINMLA